MLWAGLLGIGCLLSAPASAALRPHIVIFLADDLGWHDVGFHGSEIRTPRLDRLAASGTRLNQFYVQPQCSPTRASLLTGRYPIRQGLQLAVVDRWSDWGLPLDERTLAQALGEAGYRPVMVGKWHLGASRPALLPLARGFEHFYGHYLSAIDYFTHEGAAARSPELEGGLDWHRNGMAVREEGYATSLLAAEAVRIVEGHDPAQPLFLYLAFNAPHVPLQVPENYLEGYQQLEPEPRRIFAGMVTAMDEAIGRVLDSLEQRAMTGNTLVLFASDNGGHPDLGGSNAPLRGRKGQLYEGGIRVPAIASWPGQLAPGRTVDEPLHVVDLYPTLLRLAGAPLEQPLPLDGLDAWPTLAENARSPHEEILHNVSPLGGAIRIGEWKLVKTFGKARRTELFRITEDPTESTDLAVQRPDVVQRLGRRLAAYQRQARPALIPTPPKDVVVPEVWGDFGSPGGTRE